MGQPEPQAPESQSSPIPADSVSRSETGVQPADGHKDFIQAEYSRAGYEYHLLPEKIAQTPVTPRDRSRLLVIDSATTHQHRVFRDLPELLRPGDLLVLNNTRVIPARLYGRKGRGGGEVEILLLEEQTLGRWLALVKPGRRLKPGTLIHFGGDADRPELIAYIAATDPETNGRILEFTVPSGEPLDTVIERLGQMPLPPYITSTAATPAQYQTVYAEKLGAVAAPTAGLHFTQELFDRLQTAGIGCAFITLHVGIGTFRPVEVEDITTHRMHSEWIEVPPDTVEQIRQTQARGGRVIAVGTTATRALEGAAARTGKLEPFRGKTQIFIYPGYRWRVLDGLITNFHLPGSSLLMLVSALIGRDRLLSLYQDAVDQDYRFYSFGDAMLILPEAALP